MLDHKTWKEDPNLFSQASVDADFIVKTGFVMEAFGNHLVEAYQAVCKTQKKFRIILEYDPEEKKSWIEIRFSERCSRPEDRRVCQQSECSRKFCEMLLEKCKNGNDSFDVMRERNEWARMLSRLEKIGDLPDITTMEKIADAFQKSLAGFIAFTCTHGSLSGDESTYLISDGIRNYSRLEEILSRMKHQDTSHSETSGGAS